MSWVWQKHQNHIKWVRQGMSCLKTLGLTLTNSSNLGIAKSALKYIRNDTTFVCCHVNSLVVSLNSTLWINFGISWLESLPHLGFKLCWGWSHVTMSTRQVKRQHGHPTKNMLWLQKIKTILSFKNNKTITY